MPCGLHFALMRTFHAQKNRTRPGMTEIGLTPGQPKILRYLSLHTCCMQKEIAEALDIEPATVSQVLGNMAQTGLVRKSSAPERRRAESVSITEKGRSVCEQWQRLCDEIDEISLQGFSPEERQQFLEYLHRMYRNLTGRPLK